MHNHYAIILTLFLRWHSTSDKFSILLQFAKSLTKTALSTFLPRIAFWTNQSVPLLSPCLELFSKNDALLACDKVRLHHFFASFLLPITVILHAEKTLSISRWCKLQLIMLFFDQKEVSGVLIDLTVIPLNLSTCAFIL